MEALSPVHPVLATPEPTSFAMCPPRSLAEASVTLLWGSSASPPHLPFSVSPDPPASSRRCHQGDLSLSLARHPRHRRTHVRMLAGNSRCLASEAHVESQLPGLPCPSGCRVSVNCFRVQNQSPTHLSQLNNTRCENWCSPPDFSYGVASVSAPAQGLRQRLSRGQSCCV